MQAKNYYDGLMAAISSMRDEPNRIDLIANILYYAGGEYREIDADPIPFLDEMTRRYFDNIPECIELIKKTHSTTSSFSKLILKSCCGQLETTLRNKTTNVNDEIVLCDALVWITDRILHAKLWDHLGIVCGLIRVTGEKLTQYQANKLLCDFISREKNDQFFSEKCKFHGLIIDALTVGIAKQIGIRRVYDTYSAAREFLPREILTVKKIQNRLVRLLNEHEKAEESNQLMTLLVMKMGYNKAAEWAAHNLQKCIVGN